MSAITALTIQAIEPDDDGTEPDCGECMAMGRALAKARALLRTIRRLEPRPIKRETLDDDPAALAAISQAVYVATLRTRIDLYFASHDGDEPEIERARRGGRRTV